MNSVIPAVEVSRQDGTVGMNQHDAMVSWPFPDATAVIIFHPPNMRTGGSVSTPPFSPASRMADSYLQMRLPQSAIASSPLELAFHSRPPLPGPDGDVYSVRSVGAFTPLSFARAAWPDTDAAGGSTACRTAPARQQGGRCTCKRGHETGRRSGA